MGAFGRVVPDPTPPHCLTEAGPQNDVDASERSGAERFAADTAAPPKLNIESVDRRWGDVADSDVAEMWVEVAVQNGAGLADRGRRPTGLDDREPCLKEFAHRRPETDRTGRADTRDHHCEFAFSVLARAATGGGAVDATARVRVSSTKARSSHEPALR